MQLAELGGTSVHVRFWQPVCWQTSVCRQCDFTKRWVIESVLCSKGYRIVCNEQPVAACCRVNVDEGCLKNGRFRALPVLKPVGAACLDKMTGCTNYAGRCCSTSIYQALHVGAACRLFATSLSKIALNMHEEVSEVRGRVSRCNV